MYKKLTCETSIPIIGLILLFGSTLLVGTACTPSNSDQITSTRAAYPAEPNETEPPVLPTNTPEPSAMVPIDEPVDNSNAILSEHQWVLSEIAYRGENKDISALHSTYFQFDMDKSLLLITTPCEGTDNFVRGFGFEIIFQDEQHYTLIPQDMITVDCGEMIDAQTEHLRVLDTSQYEIQDEKLILTGKNIQIVLERDDNNP